MEEAGPLERGLWIVPKRQVKLPVLALLFDTFRQLVVVCGSTICLIDRGQGCDMLRERADFTTLANPTRLGYWLSFTEVEIRLVVDVKLGFTSFLSVIGLNTRIDIYFRKLTTILEDFVSFRTALVIALCFKWPTAFAVPTYIHISLMK